MKKYFSGLIILLMAVALTACGETDASGSGTAGVDTVVADQAESEAVEEIPVSTWEEAAVYEAEDGVCEGGTSVSSSGEITYVSGFADDGDGLVITIQVEETGFYDLDIINRSSDGGYKANYLFVDDENMGTIQTEGKEFTDSICRYVYMEAGQHTVEIQKYWGWIDVDCLKVKTADPLDPNRFDIEPVLVNSNATDNAKRLFTYMCDIYGTDILSGQFCDQGMYGLENATIWKTTGGKYPAILGLDMMEYTPSRVAHGSSSKAVDYAIEYWDQGGIVTFCWHWNAPEKYITGEWYSAFYTDSTNIDLAKIMNGEDQEGYDLLMQDIDAIAAQLQILQDAGVPILWRPLHEASGGWFWWGAAGADAYKQLYILLYDKLTDEYGLNNLIWVWNGQDKDWYPGDEYVDIIGEDIYPGEHVYTPQTAKYLEVLDYTDARKMVILSENGCMFDPDLAIRDGAMWGCFCTWGGEFINNTNLMKLSEKYTEEYMVQKVYDHEHVITRDELPDIKNYPLR